MTNAFAGQAAAKPGSETADPRAYGRILWRWKFLLLAFLVIIPIATYLFERSRPKVYQSRVLMEIVGGQQAGAASLFNQVVQQGPDTIDLLADARIVATAGAARQAAKYLHPAVSPGSLLRSVSATADQTTGLITITGSAATPQRAANIANAFARALATNQTNAAVKQLNTAIIQLQKQIRALAKGDPGEIQLSQQLARFRALRAAQNSNVLVVDPATASTVPVAPQVARSVILASIVAFLLGLGAVALAESSDRRIRHPDEAGDFTGLPLLSAIPRSAFSSSARTHEDEESFATLRASLTFFNIDRPISSVLITSPGKEDGKTMVAVRLARALARAGKDVILLDADLRRPAAAVRLGVPPSQGLGAVLVGELRLEDALRAERAPDGRRGLLRVLPAGPPPPNPSELLGSRRMADLISELMERSDILVIDSTPLLTVSDSMPLLQLVSGVMLIARINRTSRDAIARLRFVVGSGGGNALGVVATGAAGGGLYAASGYGYKTAYASADDDQNGSGGRRTKLWRRGVRDDAEWVTVSKDD